MFQINIDPESLKPKLPSRKDLKPYPVKCYLEYRGHKDAVTSVSAEVSGQWIASGTVCMSFLILCCIQSGIEIVRLSHINHHGLYIQVHWMELFVFGRLKLVDVSNTGRLVKLLNM